ncbi:hypothetical protein C8A01DRAFT_42103 [Parachaetomium inaequale]|uniref:Uncharacterized protein n=1 Tax=Parachaetomium inaequale TaxID=2588326 RepID=A0AAN6SKX6_9PEZI|nr:hypothetical protein C8A01DRAFT_42103 [Parachaetomium inaequale]
MAPHTIEQALRKGNNIPLPHYDSPAGNQKVSELGATTGKYPAPAVAIELKASEWTDIGDEVLLDINQALQAGQQLTPRLDEQYINEKEKSMAHTNEADVVRAAAIHLLHPVHQALDLCPTVNKSIMVRSEVQQNKMRTDISYYKIINGTPTPMAIIEFKKRGVFYYDQFKKAFKTVAAGATNPPAPTSNEKNVWKAAVANKKHKTLFEDNALKGMKQISAYAVDRHTKYCALFDYDALVLVRFDDYSRGKTDVGTYCSLTYIPYTAHSHEMRSALLGFLMEAWAHT